MAGAVATIVDHEEKDYTLGMEERRARLAWITDDFRVCIQDVYYLPLDASYVKKKMFLLLKPL